jgi:hypothetical protein
MGAGPRGTGINRWHHVPSTGEAALGAAGGAPPRGAAPRGAAPGGAA